MADVLVVVAHPDDESLFCGGTIATLAVRHGFNVHVVALCEGTGSRGGVGVGGYDAGRRSNHFQQACYELHASGTIFHVFPDQRSDTVPQLVINKAVERIIAQHEPKMVFTHHVGDLNIDHRRTSEAVLVATRGQKRQLLSMVPEWPSRCVGPAWNPDTRYNVESMINTKVRACLCYVDEMREYPHPRSERAIREQTVERFMEIR